MNGYEPGAPLPAVEQILDGLPPVNTSGIRVEVTPGTEWRYSGCGYVVAQALMSDATEEAFPDLMERLVLSPAGMTSSSYRQPMDSAHQQRAAHHTSPDGSALPLPCGRPLAWVRSSAKRPHSGRWE